MKIAFIITSTGWGGLEMNALKLAGLLSAKGYSITLITRETSTIYKKGKQLFSSIILLDKIKKYFDFKSAKLISDSLRSEGIKTLMVFDNKDLDAAAWTKKLFFKELIILYQQHMQIGINKKDFLHTFRFNSINLWITPLQYLKDEIAVRTKFPTEKVKVIPIGLDINKFAERKYSKEEALSKLGISTQAPLIGIIGRISAGKGQLFVVDSFYKMGNELDAELLIFGSPTVNDKDDQEYYLQILSRISRYNIQRVHIVEHNNDVALFYNAVDIFALASRKETYGMVTIEAMLSGLPIIAPESGGTKEILEEGKFGLLYEVENFEDFSQKLKRMLANKVEYENMAARARKSAIKKYSQELEAAEIDKLIKSQL
jgi:D-inositol-3-phosphate glycosyltransferase